MTDAQDRLAAAEQAYLHARQRLQQAMLRYDHRAVEPVDCTDEAIEGVVAAAAELAPVLDARNAAREAAAA
jgi:hypothetical protein